MNLIRRNYVVEILTPTPRRWTPDRRVSPSGARGLTVLGNFYATHRIDVPEFSEDETIGPKSLTITIGNALNEAQDLVMNVANRHALITIYDVRFDASWNVTSANIWFIGRTGRPQFEDDLVMIECHADEGRRGTSPTKDSRTLMTSHQPPSESTRTPWFTG